MLVQKMKKKSFFTLVVEIWRDSCRFYCSSESLKSKFCRLGNSELKIFCRDQKLPLLGIGKIVVAKSEGNVKLQEDLAIRIEANDVDIESLEGGILSK